MWFVTGKRDDVGRRKKKLNTAYVHYFRERFALKGRFDSVPSPNPKPDWAEPTVSICIGVQCTWTGESTSCANGGTNP